MSKSFLQCVGTELYNLQSTMKGHSNKSFSTLVSWIALSGRRIKELHGDHQQRKISIYLISLCLLCGLFQFSLPLALPVPVNTWQGSESDANKTTIAQSVCQTATAKRNARWLFRDQLQCNMSSLLQLLSMKTCSIFKFLRQIYFSVKKYHFASSLVSSQNSIYTFTNVSFSLMTLLLLKIKRVKLKFTLL